MPPFDCLLDIVSAVFSNKTSSLNLNGRENCVLKISPTKTTSRAQIYLGILGSLNYGQCHGHHLLVFDGEGVFLHLRRDVLQPEGLDEELVPKVEDLGLRQVGQLVVQREL